MITRADPLVAIVIHGLTGGGAERAMLRLARGLAESELSVDLVVGDVDGPLRDLIPERVSLINLGSNRMRRAIVPLATYLRRRRPVATLSAMTHVNLATIIAATLARSGCRVIVSERNTLSEAARSSERSMDRLLARATARLYPRADAVLAVSQGVADDLAETSGLARKDIQVAYNPVVEESLWADAAKAVDHPWFSEDQLPVVLGVGRLVPAKDFESLLLAFHQVRRERDVRLVILGEGPQRGRLEQQVSRLGLGGAVDLPGFVPNPYAFMKRSALFVLSSRREGMPNVLIEAAALDTPVVATDCPSGPREVLDGGRHAPLVPVGDVERLAEAMLRQLEQPTRVPAHALEPFRRETAVDVYRQVLLGEGGNVL